MLKYGSIVISTVPRNTAKVFPEKTSQTELFSETVIAEISNIIFFAILFREKKPMRALFAIKRAVELSRFAASGISCIDSDRHGTAASCG